MKGRSGGHRTHAEDVGLALLPVDLGKDLVTSPPGASSQTGTTGDDKTPVAAMRPLGASIFNVPREYCATASHRTRRQRGLAITISGFSSQPRPNAIAPCAAACCGSVGQLPESRHCRNSAGAGPSFVAPARELLRSGGTALARACSALPSRDEHPISALPRGSSRHHARTLAGYARIVPPSPPPLMLKPSSISGADNPQQQDTAAPPSNGGQFQTIERGQFRVAKSGDQRALRLERMGIGNRLGDVSFRIVLQALFRCGRALRPA